tara:strand:+ start:6496 stop:6612 length:117 start_codon:yes stop_codon:yes gene_type:complete
MDLKKGLLRIYLMLCTAWPLFFSSSYFYVQQKDEGFNK